MAKIAYLIYTHEHPAMLARAISNLQYPGADFYVHVDRKVAIEPFKEATASLSNIQFLESRYKVYWMGYSMVLAVIELLRTARAAAGTRGGYDYYVLLSGGCFPIKSNQHIHETLARAGDTLFLHFFRIQTRPQWRRQIEQYHFVDSPLTNRRTLWIKRTRRLYNALHTLLHKMIPKRKFIAGYEPFGGSDYWMLPQAAVDYVLEKLATDQCISKYYRFTESPIEMMFHTILLNSPLASQVRTHHEYFAGGCVYLPMAKGSLRFAEWDESRERPATLDDRDFPALAVSECLFARKFSLPRSSSLLARVEAELLPKNACKDAGVS